MSLQLAAQHMASRGRGPDTTLVHMAPQEVAGLQALAKAHGGSLTINPDTGLPEAGFLSSILPTVIGAGLSIASGGTLTPLMAAGITGAGYGLATGSLKKGLMAGLGAYGGAGLAGGLTAAGAAGTAGAAGAVETGLTASGGVMGANPMVAQPMTFGVGPDATAVLGSGTAPAASIPSTYATNPEAFASNAYSAGPSTAKLTAGVPQVATTTPMSDRFSQAFQGAKNLSTPEGRELFMGNAASKGVEAKGVGGMKGLMQYGLMGLGPAALELMTPEQRAAEEKAKLQPKNYNFAYNQRANPNAGYTGAQTGERLHFDPVYTPISAAGGGLMDIGPVQAMSDRNEAQTLMANQGQMFAEGGETKAVKPVEEDPYYTMSGQSGDAFKYLMGQMPASPKAPAPAAAPAVVQSTVQPVAAPSSPFSSFSSPAIPGSQAGQDGEWVDDTSGNVKPYIFDPATGMFTAAPAPKVFRPYTPAPAASTMTGGTGGYAQGGITGSGNLNLNIPLDLGGGQGGYGGTGGGSYPFAGVGGTAQPGFIGYNNVAGGGYAAPSINPAGTGAPASGAQGFGQGFGPQVQYNPEYLATMDTVRGKPATGSIGPQLANGGIASLAQGGQSHLGDYSDGGRLLKGPGDGVSDSIPATIANKRPARLADGEFVVPARIVSELGNGSTEAGARKLYAMMDRVQKARKKSIGKNRVAVNSRTEKLLPA